MDLEGADSRTTEGLCARKRLLAMATVWRNWQTGTPTMRSLIPRDH